MAGIISETSFICSMDFILHGPLWQPLLPILPVDVNRFMFWSTVFMVFFMMATGVEQVRNDMQSAIPSGDVIRSNIVTVDHKPGEVAGRTRKRNLDFVAGNLNI